MKEHGKHVGILPTGELKSALATGKEMAAHFGVRLIVSGMKRGACITFHTWIIGVAFFRTLPLSGYQRYPH